MKSPPYIVHLLEPSYFDFLDGIRSYPGRQMKDQHRTSCRELMDCCFDCFGSGHGGSYLVLRYHLLRNDSFAIEPVDPRSLNSACWTPYCSSVPLSRDHARDCRYP